MGCGQCGFENDAESRFCGDCGAPLEVTCPGCQATVRPGLKFCTQCGTAVGDTPAAPAAAAPSPPAGPTLVAQRKTITVVFGDVGGSTGLGERLDPEASREVMNQYHRDVLEVIGEHGGTVDKFNGDGFMATFGIPEVSEDDASRAVSAAVEIQRRFTPFAAGVHERHGGDPITLRIGVNTGEIVIAEGDPDIIGDALNVAARLERAAPSGGVLVGPETWRLTRSAWSYEPQGEVTVAGRVEPVEVFLVQAAASEPAETATPFVGRDAELDVVRAQRDEAVATPSLRLVNVIGSPGLGKSRLAREVAAGLDFDHRHTIACERAGSSTFAPVIDLVRSVAGVGPTESPEAIMAALRQRFAEADFADREAERLHDAMAGLVGAGPIRSTEESFWAVRRMVELVGREGPTLVVVDDIQWAEPVVLDLLEHLAEWVAGASVLLLCLARPEIRDLRPSLTEAGRRADAVIALEGLDAEATAALAQRMLGEGELPAALVERIPTSTEGNPLFVRELVKMLVDDGVIERGTSGWELTIDAEAVEVPPTIASLLAARIDRLDDTERFVLERAAVIGPEFAEGALRSIAGEVAGGLPTVLERLRRMELVEPTGSYWGDHAVHRFHHVLIRDAAYRRLLKGARADLHEQVAGWLGAEAEGLPGDHDETVAFHEEQAFRYRSELGPLVEASIELGRRAAARLAAAAGRALARDDLTAAGPLALRALDCLPADGEDRGELLLTACEALLGTGDVVRGEAAVDELDALATDDRLRAWAACFRAQLTSMTEPDRLPEAEQEATSAAGILEALRDDAGAAKGHLTRARILALLGRVGEAETELDLALTAAREAGDARRITAVLGNAPLAALWGPSPVPRAGGRCLDIVRLLRITTRAPAVEATSMRCQALLEALRGRFDTAHTMIDRCRRKVDELGLRLGSLETELFAGQIELLAGDEDAAEIALRKASTGLTAMRLGAEAGQATALLARVLVTKGEIGEAEVLVDTAEQMAGRNLKSAVAWRLARAELLLAAGEADEAVAVARAAVDVVAETDLVVDQTDAELVLAKALRAAGDETGASASSRRARELAERKGATVMVGGWEAQARAVDPPTSDASAAPRVEARPGAHPGVEPWRPQETSVMAMFRRIELAIASREGVTMADCLAPGLDWVEHRPLFAGRFDLGEVLTSTDPLEHAQHDLLLCTSDRVALVVARYVTKDFTNELLHAARIDTDGRMVAAHTHELDQLGEAVASYHGLFVADAEAYGEPLLLNAAVRVANEVNAYQAIGDIDGCAPLLAEEIDHHEHREGAFGLVDLLGRDAVLRTYRSVMAGGGYITGRVVRTSGDHLALMVYERGGGEFPVDFVAMHGVDAAGRLGSTDSWDLDDWDQAVAEFERRAAALDGSAVEPWDPEQTSVMRGLRKTVAANAAGDPAGVVAMTADGFEWRDHRPAVGGVYDGETVAQSMALARELSVRVVLCSTDRVTLVHYKGTGGPFEIDFLAVVVGDVDGLGLSGDTFDLDQLDEAIDCYFAAIEQDAAVHGDDLLLNTSSRTSDRMTAHLTVGDPEGAGAQVTDDARRVEHRQYAAGVGDIVGRAAIVAMFRTLGDVEWVGRTIAEGGDRLALRIWRVTSQDFPVQYVSLVESGPDGRQVLSEGWDLTDADQAFQALERRAAALDAPPVEPWDQLATTVAQTSAVALDAMNSADHELHRTMYADGFVWFDHRPMVDGTFDAEALLDTLRPIQRIDAAPVLGGVDRVEIVAITITAQDFTHEFLNVHWCSPDGPYVSIDTFDLSDLDAAVDRYRELVVEDAERFGGSVVANDASRLVDRLDAHLSLGRVDGLEEFYAPEMVQHERRGDIGELVLRGRDEVVENVRIIAASGGSLTARTVRVAGDRLALRVQNFTADGFRIDAAGLVELDDEGRLQYGRGWDLADWADAVAELDRRAAALARPPVEAWDPESTPVYRTIEAGAKEIVSGDFDRHRQRYADDFVYTDHRPGLIGTFDADQQVDSFRGADRVDSRPILLTSGRVGLFLFDAETQGLSIVFLTVAHLRPDGRMRSFDAFEIEQLDAAIDRYHEVLVEDAEHFGGEIAINDASRLGDRVQARLALGRTDDIGLLVTGDMTYTDRRKNALGLIDARDRAETVEAYESVGPTDLMVSRTVRTAGETLSLRVTHQSTQGYPFDYVTVFETDGERATSTTLWDLDDWDHAVAEFDRRAAAAAEAPGSGRRDSLVEPWDAEATTVIRMLRRSEQLVAAGLGASDELASLVTEDLIYADHRPTSAGEYTKEQFVEGLGMTEELRITPLLCGTDRVAVDLRSFEVGGFVIEIVNVCAVTPDGKMWITENYEPADLDAAVDRYQELVGEDAERHGGEVHRNAAAVSADRLKARGNLVGYEDIGGLLADDVAVHDRRSHSGFGTVGRPDVERNFAKAFPRASEPLLTGRTLRTAGERLALVVESYRIRAQDFTVDYLALMECDTARLLTSFRTYDLEQWDEAVAEFERRAATLTNPPVEPWDPEATAAMRTFRVWEDQTNRGEHHRNPMLYPERLTWVDHRPMFAGTFGADELYRSLHPVQQGRLRPILVAADRVALAHITMDVKDFDSEVLELIHVDPDGIVVVEHSFDVDQLDEAVDVYHQLVVEDAERFGGAVVANRASRMSDLGCARLSMGQVDRVQALFAPDFVQIDHRSGFGHRMDGWSAFEPNLLAVFDGEATMWGPTVRVAGERLALKVVRWVGHGFAVDMLMLVESDAIGLDRAHDLYDLDQYDEAMAEFDRRLAAIEAGSVAIGPWDPEATTSAGCVRAVARAILAGDTDAHRSIYVEDLVYTDHRPVFAGVYDREQLVLSFLGATRFEYRPVLMTTDRVALHAYAVGAEGFTTDFICVGASTADGLVRSVDCFEVDQLDEAIDRYFEVVREDADLYGGEVIENTASGVTHRINAHLAVGDVAGCVELWADDVRHIEKRRDAMGLADASGKDAVERNAERVAVSLVGRTIRVAGERLALLVVRAPAPDFPVDMLALVESAPDGRYRFGIAYDLEQYDEAMAEFDRRAAH